MTMRVPCKPSPNLPPYQQYSTAESRFRKLCCFTRVYKEPRPLDFDSESCNCGGGLRLADRCPMRALFPLVSISCGHWSRSPFTEVYTVAYPWGAVPARSAFSTIEVQISSDVAGHQNTCGGVVNLKHYRARKKYPHVSTISPATNRSCPWAIYLSILLVDLATRYGKNLIRWEIHWNHLDCQYFRATFSGP
jgi:hypothetical protein